MRFPLALAVFSVVSPGLASTLFVGSAGGPEQAPGLFAATFDSTTGTLTAPARLATGQPFFFLLNRAGDRLYATGHDGEGATPSVLRTYAVDPASAALTLRAIQPLGGKVPVHATLTPDAHFALVAHYLTPTVVCLAVPCGGPAHPAPSTVAASVTLTGASLSPDRQDHAYPHSVNLSPDGHFAYVCDRGADRIAAFVLDRATGALTPLDRPILTRPGAGPRHLTFHPDGTRAYVVNEINGSLTVYRHDPVSGHLTEGASYPAIPGDFTGENLSAEVRVHPNGRFVYVSNRGPDTLAGFAIGDGDRLSPVQTIASGGAHPRYFVIDPTGRWLLCSNRLSDSVTVFALNPSSGRLTRTAHPLTVPTPLGLVFRP